MTRLFIWWHRRRAAHHAALKTSGSIHQGFYGREYVSRANFHKQNEEWHLAQIKRLSAPAPGQTGAVELPPAETAARD